MLLKSKKFQKAWEQSPEPTVHCGRKFSPTEWKQDWPRKGPYSWLFRNISGKDICLYTGQMLKKKKLTHTQSEFPFFHNLDPWLFETLWPIDRAKGAFQAFRVLSTKSRNALHLRTKQTFFGLPVSRLKLLDTRQRWCSWPRAQGIQETILGPREVLPINTESL